jgi:hypothetical protein
MRNNKVEIPPFRTFASTVIFPSKVIELIQCIITKFRGVFTKDRNTAKRGVRMT